MREKNLALILNTLHENAPMSRMALATKTQLNKATVSVLVQELRNKRLVREIGIDPDGGEVGRPAINLEINPEAGRLIGAEIGVGYISAVATDFAGNIKTRHYEDRLDFESQTQMLDAFITMLEACCDEARRDHQQIFGIGVGVPGLVNSTTRRLLFAPNLGWSEVELRQVLEERFDLPLFLENEANMAALGEYYFGAEQNSNYTLYISVGVGLGVGIVQHGDLLTGASGFAGEAGHMMLVPDGLPCNCGSRGCWETLVSQQALIRYLDQAIRSGVPSSIDLQQMDQKGQTAHIITAAGEGDEAALRAFQEMGLWYGLGLANLINILNPERVVLGGMPVMAYQIMMPIIEQTLHERALHWSLESCDIVTSSHGPDACMMGGVSAVYRNVLSQPINWTV